MKLIQSILLFLPLCFVICFVCSTLRRETMTSILHHTARLFLYLTGTVLAVCAALHFIMEWVLGY